MDNVENQDQLTVSNEDLTAASTANNSSNQPKLPTTQVINQTFHLMNICLSFFLSWDDRDSFLYHHYLFFFFSCNLFICSSPILNMQFVPGFRRLTIGIMQPNKNFFFLMPLFLGLFWGYFGF